MTTQMDSSATDALDIGNAFVQRFYTILHKDPTQAFRFYLDSSALSRPGPDGVMKSVTTVEDINELILSLDCQSYKAEITFAHAQFSYGNGLVVLVTGCLIGKNNVRRKFTQSFFLAPQEGGYYVLNDVFRYIDDEEPEDAANNDLNESTEAALYPEPEVTQVPSDVEANHASAPSDDGDYSDKEVSHPLDNSNISVLENEVVAVQPAPSSEKSLNDSHPGSQIASPRIEDDAPKKSYLTIVHALTQNSSPFISRPPPPKPKPVVEQSRKAAAPEASTPQSNNVSERNNDFSGKNTSIFVANLPLNATEEMLSEAFKNFGPIKPNGIQVRSFKENKNCFGFVEFESATSVQSAVAASPITIGNRKANIEEKRGGYNGGRQGRGAYRDENGFRSDNLRGRGNFNGGRNFGRNDRSESSGQARGNTGRNGDANRKSYQNGGERVAAGAGHDER